MKVEIRDSRVHQVLDVHGTLEHVATGFSFVEGPVWHPREGHLIFSDILGNAMHRWSPKDGVSLYRQPSKMANGNSYDRQGRLLTCEHATSQVTRTDSDGWVTVVASHYQGMELNSPNDIVVRSDGAVYFTDPNSGRSAKWGVAREQELPFQGVYRLDPDDRVLTLLVDDFDKPNGLCFSPDESQLFISDTNRYHIRVFEVRPDGALAPGGRVWAEMSREGVGVPDGMKADRDGNLYCTGPGGIHLFGPHAVYLGIIQMPEQATNLAWGDEDLCSLFITATTSVYRLRTTVPGQAAF